MLGILGGGQLARMSTYAAHRLGIPVAIIARPTDDNPASHVTHRTFLGDWSDPALLEQVARECSVVTLENEFVDPKALAWLEAKGVKVHPSSACVAMVQDKYLQKCALRDAGLPVPRFAATDTVADVVKAAETLGWPLMLKCRRLGYDGYGNELLRTPADVEPGFQKLARRGSALMVEEFVPFTRELAIMVVRRPSGEEAVYPLVETVQHAHVCHTVLAPADVSARTQARAEAVAREMMRAVGGTGIFAVEMFLLADGEVLINELAPRPHNSAHYSMEACATSQFENHVRAVLDLPLGSTAMVVPAAAMVNLLATQAGPPDAKGLADALKVPGATVHLYGKSASRPGRKMGHVTAVGSNIREVRELALKAARCITL